MRRPDGSGLYTAPSPRGQSFEWRDFFQAVGTDLEREHALAAVQLAALLLRSESVWSALGSTCDVAQELLADPPSHDESEQSDRERSANDAIEIIMCVRRRWYLALRALAWLEVSLQREQPFDFLRPNDLACFAITSLLPTYPRSLVVVSHRSCDVKEQLLRSKAWRSNEVLIDATFRPEWQTNRAMVWSLFSATPVICKVQSERYADSEWCNREAEMFAHLCEHTDFLEGRHFFEIESADVGVIERSARSSPDTHRMLDIAAGIESPPFELNCWTAWQGALVRAGAIAKFVYRTLLLGSRKDGPSPIELSNELLEMMGDENQQLADHPMMGFDRIWQRLADGVRADAKNVDLKAPLVTVKSMDQASETEPRAALERSRSLVRAQWADDPRPDGHGP